MVSRWEGVGELGGWMKGFRNTDCQLQNSLKAVKYSLGNAVNNTLVMGAGLMNWRESLCK